MSTDHLDRLNIAEKTSGSLVPIALLRWALVIIFLWFGGMKFTSYEANGIAPFIANSPFMGWLHSLFGIQGASYVIGVVELSTAAALIIGAFNAFFSALGAAMSTVTYIITLTFFASTPGVAEPMAGGFPAISAAPGQFLLKDLVLLAASVCLLAASVRRPSSPTAKMQSIPCRRDRRGSGADLGGIEWITFSSRDATASQSLESTMFDMRNLSLLKKLDENAPDAMKAFWVFDKAAFADGALTAQQKQLIAVAVALTTQCPYCVALHTKAARVAGASDAQLSEAALVAAAIRAGGAVTHATHLFEG